MEIDALHEEASSAVEEQVAVEDRVKSLTGLDKDKDGKEEDGKVQTLLSVKKGPY